VTKDFVTVKHLNLKNKTMKTFIRFLLLSLIPGILLSCSGGTAKTIANLKEAYNGESTASAKYAAFAEKAAAEGFDTVAVMFRATSNSEAVHAGNHKKVLEKLGVKVGAPELGKFEVQSTEMNLADAIKGETYEIEQMYPGFISTADQELITDASESFTWAIETEKKHQSLYNTALGAVKGGSESTLPVKWFVCPTCGNTYDEATLTDDCDFCMTSKNLYIAF
jgi:rubrerythrin